MKKTISKIIISILPTTTLLLSTCFSEKISDDYDTYFWNEDIMTQLNVPGKNGYDFNGINDIVIMAKEILARAIEYIPMIVLVVLLLACLKIIFDGDGKDGLKRIKYIAIGIVLMILSVYVVNILSTIFFGHPVLNIHLNRWYY